MHLRSIPLLLVLLLAAGATATADTPVRHPVVVVVWDGMRPDFVSEQNTPHLWALAQSGVFFAEHHPVYPSATEVNGTALATGAYPAHSTVLGNKEFRPEIDPERPVSIENPSVIRRADELTRGRDLAIGTLAEFLHAQGMRTAIAGAKQVALLADRALRPDDPASSPVVYEGAALPPHLETDLATALGNFPAIHKNTAGRGDKIARDAWTTRALLEVLWKDGVPPFSLLWLAEPDYSQHETGPGSAASLTAIRSSDDNLGRVLAELERRGARASTDVLVVSDHGFSTIMRALDVAADLSAAGFDATRIAPGGLHPGQVLVVSNGGTVFFYVGGRDPVLCRRVAAWVQTRDWAGVVFAREPMEGTFPLATGHLDSPEAPDVVVALRWSWDRSATGTPGLICSDGLERGPGQGNHASLSATDMHNTLVAAGPDFRTGVRDPLPSANTDLTPTILWILGFPKAAAQRDGRVLGEALVGPAPPLRSFEIKRLTAQRNLGNGQIWEQYLNVSELNGVQYFDEGNGALRLESGDRGPESARQTR
jgi:arylsulfatase A-like enzyme